MESVRSAAEFHLEGVQRRWVRLRTKKAIVEILFRTTSLRLRKTAIDKQFRSDDVAAVIGCEKYQLDRLYQKVLDDLKEWRHFLCKGSNNISNRPADGISGRSMPVAWMLSGCRGFFLRVAILVFLVFIVTSIFDLVKHTMQFIAFY